MIEYLMQNCERVRNLGYDLNHVTVLRRDVRWQSLVRYKLLGGTLEGRAPRANLGIGFRKYRRRRKGLRDTKKDP